jgi:hypothetical protein
VRHLPILSTFPGLEGQGRHTPGAAAGSLLDELVLIVWPGHPWARRLLPTAMELDHTEARALPASARAFLQVLHETGAAGRPARNG